MTEENELYLGSSCFVAPRPYNGMTLSLLIAALHTGQTCLVGLVSNHWCRHGQLHSCHSNYSIITFHLIGVTLLLNIHQNRWPHILTTASFAVSKQILHSNILSSFSFSSVEPADPDDLEEPACSLVLLILKTYPYVHSKILKIFLHLDR